MDRLEKISELQKGLEAKWDSGVDLSQTVDIKLDRAELCCLLECCVLLRSRSIPKGDWNPNTGATSNTYLDILEKLVRQAKKQGAFE